MALKVGIVGCGQIATVHIPYIQARPGARIVGVTDPDSRRAAETAARFGIPAVCRSLKELLDTQRPDVLHVRTVAPFELREARIAERYHISLAAARAQIKASDRQRRIFLKRFYNIDGNDPLLYDLVINTDHMTAEAACNLICSALEQERFHST